MTLLVEKQSQELRSSLKKNICCGILEEVEFMYFVVEVWRYEFRTI